MKTVIVSVLAVMLIGCSGNKKVEVKTDRQKFSYAVGLTTGANMAKDSLDLDYDVYLQGIKDAGVDSSKRLMSLADVEKALTTWQTEKQRSVSQKNLDAGDKFLTENKKEPGVIELPSGLQYKVITEGKGPHPRVDQSVLANYVGTFINGQEFYSSRRIGQPEELKVNGVMPGWTEALQLMSVGSKWKIFIPAKLAYGDVGIRNLIAPGTTLIFEIELLAIK